MDGYFTASITAPHSSGLHPMTYSIDCMPEQGIDTTSQSEAVLWILVDGDGQQLLNSILQEKNRYWSPQLIISQLLFQKIMESMKNLFECSGG